MPSLSQERRKEMQDAELERLRLESLDALKPERITDKGEIIRELVEACEYLISDAVYDDDGYLVTVGSESLDKLKAALEKAKATK